ncbi:dienelactone hydrolase family protein [Candidatus Pelagibacter sp. Uisw_116]|uniref:dienelactone hydrolase family protein n=1 Tax=Candidatus Pelagibacter sp. Uisw_116 TaxID=3230986 RepID=UPI0039EB7874
MVKIIKLVILCLMISKVSVSKEISCKENPGCENFPEIIKFEGIKFPLTMVQKDQGKKPTAENYYIFHFKPLKDEPSPYVIIIPTSGGITKAAAVTFERYKNKLLDKGFGVIILDQFYNTGIEKGTLSQGPLASMGALSIIEYIKNNHPNLTNNKFGVMGGSRGGMTVLSLASPITRENFIYKNVKQWFDAGVAFYPSCGKQELTMPVVVFIGELDEWVSATNCKMWKKRDEEQISSGLLQIFIYKNAHHAFNRELIKKLYRPSKDDHDLAGRAVQYNKKADKHSQKKMIKFFVKYLK